MSWNQKKLIQEQRAKAIQQSRTLLDEIEKAGREPTATDEEVFAKIDKEVKGYDKRISLIDNQLQLEQVSTNVNDGIAQDAFNGSRKTEKASTEEVEAKYAKSFDAWARTGVMDQVMADYVMTKGSDIVGPQSYYPQIVDFLKVFAGPVQAGAEIIPTSNGNDLPMACGDDTAQKGELVATEDTAATDQDVTPTYKTLRAYQFSSKTFTVSRTLLQDSGYDVQGYIVRKAAERLGRGMNYWTTRGTGSGQPEGILTSATRVTYGDFGYDQLVEHFHAVDQGYRNDPTCGWMCSDGVMAEVRKMKDGDGRYIFTPGTAGAPDLLLGKKVTINPDCEPDSIDDSDEFALRPIPMLFGAWSYYKVRVVNQVTLQRFDDSAYAKKFQVGFLADLRWDSLLSNASAIKAMYISGS